MRVLSVAIVIFLTATCGQKGPLDVPLEKAPNSTAVKASKIYLVSNCAIFTPLAEYRRCSQIQ